MNSNCCEIDRGIRILELLNFDMLEAEEEYRKRLIDEASSNCSDSSSILKLASFWTTILNLIKTCVVEDSSFVVELTPAKIRQN